MTRQDFIITVRRKALQDTTFIPASVPKVGFFAGFIGGRLKEATRERRLAVLQAITGLPLTSFKQMTSNYIDIIVEEVQHADSNIIEDIEQDCARLSEGATGGAAPWDLYPWDRPTFSMPVL